MDRLAILSRDLSSILDQLHTEAAQRELAQLQAPLAWLDEANGWLRYELTRAACPDMREAVPFTYIPVHLRK
ncbi:MAG: hypothetical protein ACYDEB_05360 [Dehalococcoidia bacterium]